MTQHENNQEPETKISPKDAEFYAEEIMCLAGKLHRMGIVKFNGLSPDAATIAAAIIYGNLLRKPKD